MTTYHAQWAWRGGESADENVRITVDGSTISAVEVGVAPRDGDVVTRGVVMPGLVNAHSHAFHRALRGNTHGGSGDFWSWREPMYAIANRLTPDNYRALATAVFAEMALAGVTGVGEFHYVHHPAEGGRYSDPNEMGKAMVDAARVAGVKLALLDVAYLHAGLDKPEPLAEQRRFSDGSMDAWLDRVDLLGEGGENWTVGLAPHSVRAVHPHDLEAVVANRHGRVVHLHVSEQPAENAACLAATGKTPTGVLAEAGLLGPHLCAVHATHLTDDDIALLGASGSHVCFCPTTERDLADGIGPAKRLVGAGATLCVGSDSHAVIDLFEEARAIEQDERLITGVRGNHSPVSLLEAATGNGSTSLGWQRHGIAVGSPADFIALETNSVRLASFDPQRAAAHIVYSAAPADVRDVWVGGKRIVENFVHRTIDDVPASLRTAISAVVTL